MKKFTKIITLVLAVALLSAFTDVPKKHWAYTYVDKAQKLKIVRGVSDTIFNPDSTINKQEIAQMLINVYVLKNPVSDETYNECVSNSAVALQQAKVAEWAYPVVSYGLVNEFWNINDFLAPVNDVAGGTSVITREMMARWICNTMNYKTFGLRVIHYADRSDIDPAYYAYVDSLYRHGIMQGSDVGFQAKDGMTRAQAATVAVNIYEKEETETLANNPFVYESGVITSVNTTYNSFVIGEKILQIAENAKILLNGKSVSFSDIAELNGKNISASMYLAGDNIQSVIVQTKPIVVVGTVDALVNKDSYKVITITADGVKADYVINDNSEVLSSLNTGSSVQFISDGIYVLEIQ